MTEITGQSSVRDRIKHLKRLLSKWEEEGVPEGVTIPKSNLQAKSWALPEYQVFPIGSKRDWRTTHEIWGNDIQEIAATIKRLHNNKTSHRPYEPERLRRLRTQAKLAESEATLEKVIAQWHSERERADIAETRQQHLLKKLELLEAEKAAIAAENAELVRRISFGAKTLQVVS